MNRPQNPVYRVDAAAYSACLPKVVCGHCGAVLTLQLSKDPRRIRCCACGGMNAVSRHDGEWRATAASESRPSGDPSPVES